MIPVAVDKVVAIATGQGSPRHYVVLSGVSGEGRLAILIGPGEALSLAATLDGVDLGRPQAAGLTAAIVGALGGEVTGVALDRMVDGCYCATVHVDGPGGASAIDARASDALNVAAVLGTPIVVAERVLVAAAAASVDEVTGSGLRLAVDAEAMRPRRVGEPTGWLRRGRVLPIQASGLTGDLSGAPAHLDEALSPGSHDGRQGRRRYRW